MIIKAWVLEEGEKARKEKERPCRDVSAMMACTLQLVL